jgi:quinol monooxygenase YgiN
MKEPTMVKFGLFVRLEVTPGKEAEAEALLRSGLGIVAEESGTPLWFALRFGPSTFGIFDAFADEAGREAHLAGRLAAALLAKAPDLLSRTPVIERLDVLAAKVT